MKIPDVPAELQDEFTADMVEALREFGEVTVVDRKVTLTMPKVGAPKVVELPYLQGRFGVRVMNPGDLLTIDTTLRISLPS